MNANHCLFVLIINISSFFIETDQQAAGTEPLLLWQLVIITLPSSPKQQTVNQSLSIRRIRFGFGPGAKGIKLYARAVDIRRIMTLNRILEK